MEEKWSTYGSALATSMLLLTIIRQYFSQALSDRLFLHASKLLSRFHPYIEITFAEHSTQSLKRSEAYSAVESYLSAAPCLHAARRLKADPDHKPSSIITLSMDEHEEVVDVFASAKFHWSSLTSHTKTPSFSFNPSPPERRFYRLSFHRRYRELVAKTYLPHVMEEGKVIGLKNRVRRIYTNVSSYGGYDYGKRGWSHAQFEHPATFGTIAMDPGRKREIVEDLVAFSEGKEFYARIGKAWKRG